MRDLVFIDLETTHLNPQVGEIIEIAIVRVTKERELRYVSKIKPERLHLAQKRSLEINGYNEEEWIDAPRARDVAGRVADLIAGGLLVGHNVSFDFEYLEEFLHVHGQKFRASYRKIDTMVLAHEHLPFLSSYSLATLRDFFGLSQEGAHRAEKDLDDMRSIYRRLCRASLFSRLYWRVRFWFLNRRKAKILS